MKSWILFVLAFGHCVESSFQPLGIPFKSPVNVAPGFSAHVIFSNLETPRGITFDSLNNILVVERTVGLTAFSKINFPVEGWERKVVIPSTNFTQGVQVNGNQLYISTASQVLLYDYDPSTKSVSGPEVVLVDDLPPDGELTTHTLQLGSTPSGPKVFVASGPFTNIDLTARNPSSGRSQIRCFNIPSNTTQSWLSGELIAYGLRNPNGFAFSPITPTTTLFVVDNGASIDNVTRLSAAFVNDNPADELDTINFVSGGGPSYGFPDCATIWNAAADPVGDPQYLKFTRDEQFSLLLESDRGNVWCQNQTNNVSPSLSFQAHSVPLDIKFYTMNGSHLPYSFPRYMYYDAFVSFHGSFNRTPPTGYGVAHVPFESNAPRSHVYNILIQAKKLKSCPGSCIRPVGLAFGNDGKLYISSDSSGELFVVQACDGY